jgi:hypothetical protein
VNLPNAVHYFTIEGKINKRDKTHCSILDEHGRIVAHAPYSGHYAGRVMLGDKWLFVYSAHYYAGNLAFPAPPLDAFIISLTVINVSWPLVLGCLPLKPQSQPSRFRQTHSLQA